jgi:hypothetical protein
VSSLDCNLDSGGMMNWIIVVSFIVGESYFVQFGDSFLSILSHGSGWFLN